MQPRIQTLVQFATEMAEGRPAEFGSLLKVPRVQLHLDAPLMDTFHHMVSADALVMAASTLSDVAAWMAVGRGARIFAHPAADGLLRYIHRDLAVTHCA